TYHMGHAVVRAAESVREQLAAIAKAAGLPADTPAATLMKKRFGMQAGNLVGVGDFAAPYAPPDPATGQSPDITPYWMIGGTGAEVEVDTQTGAVKVLRLVNVADLGAPVNPAIVATQLSGAAVMQLGFTLTEDMRFDEAGQLRNASLAEYRIPGLADVPPMENEIVESRETRGPFGAKGVGESATFGVSPAIANAIEDAVGVRIDTLPITAEAVLRALRARDGRPLPEEAP
ncbi:MAG TPA: molybdopterin-dependent oxidoreductase, partial [Usitatibacteraceae bacterium]|nr:molybdopterin-dependent oxidoreductase [Usitatibacteraceae bacterium]